MKKLILLIIIVFCSCKTTIATNYKINYDNQNFYVDYIYIDYEKDSIFFMEINRDGFIRSRKHVKLSECKIQTKY